MASISTVPPRLDIIAYGGDDTRITFNFAQDDGETPYELIGTHKAQIRPDQNSTDSWDLDVIIDEENVGVAYIVISSEVAAEVVVDATPETIYLGEEVVTAPMFTGVWDWEFTDGPNTRTLVFGIMTIIGEVTR